MELEKFLAEELEKATVAGPFRYRDSRYEPSNPENLSKTPEVYFDIDPNDQLDEFLSKIDEYRSDVRQSGDEIDKKVGNKSGGRKFFEKVAEIGVPVLAGVAAKEMISNSLGPLSSAVTGLITGGVKGHMRTRSIDTETGENLNEFVQKHYIGIDRNIENRTGIGGFLSRVSKALNYLEYRAAGEGINLGFTTLGGSRVKERASRIAAASESLGINLDDNNLFQKVQTFLEENTGNQQKINDLQSFVSDMYVQSRVSGFSETHDPQLMSRRIKSMATISFALVNSGKRDIVDTAFNDSIKEIKAVSKRVKRSYIISSAVNSSLKSLAAFNTFQTIGNFFTPETASEDVIDTFHDLENSSFENVDVMSDTLSNVDALSTDRINIIDSIPSEDEIVGYESRISELYNEISMLNSEKFDTSNLVSINNGEYPLPDWLKSQDTELYFDQNGLEVQTLLGPSEGDSFGAIYNESGEVVGLIRENNFGSNSNNELILDFFEDGPLKDGDMPTSIHTYTLGSDISQATDATEINLSLIDNKLTLTSVDGSNLLQNPIEIINVPDNSSDIERITFEIESLQDILNNASDLKAQANRLQDTIDYLNTYAECIQEANNASLEEISLLPTNLPPNLRQYLNDFLIGTYALFSYLDASDNKVQYGEPYNNKNKYRSNDNFYDNVHAPVKLSVGDTEILPFDPLNETVTERFTNLTARLNDSLPKSIIPHIAYITASQAGTPHRPNITITKPDTPLLGSGLQNSNAIVNIQTSTNNNLLTNEQATNTLNQAYFQALSVLNFQGINIEEFNSSIFLSSLEELAKSKGISYTNVNKLFTNPNITPHDLSIIFVKALSSKTNNVGSKTNNESVGEINKLLSEWGSDKAIFQGIDKFDDLHKKYRELQKKYHPDMHTSASDEEKEVYKRIIQELIDIYITRRSELIGSKTNNESVGEINKHLSEWDSDKAMLRDIDNTITLYIKKEELIKKYDPDAHTSASDEEKEGYKRIIQELNNIYSTRTRELLR